MRGAIRRGAGRTQRLRGQDRRGLWRWQIGGPCRSSAWTLPWSTGTWTSATAKPEAAGGWSAIPTPWSTFGIRHESYSAAAEYRPWMRTGSRRRVGRRASAGAGGRHHALPEGVPRRASRRMPAADPDAPGYAILAAMRRKPARHAKPLHQRLTATSIPVAAERIHPNNFSRIQRALEVYELTGAAPVRRSGEGGSGTSFERLGAGLVEFGIEPESRDCAARADREARLDAHARSQGFIRRGRPAQGARVTSHVDLPSMRCGGLPPGLGASGRVWTS